MTGQVIFRDSIAKTDDGDKLMMVCGIVKVPDDFICKGEHQYVITGCVNGNIHLQIHVNTGLDLTTELMGMTPSQMITSPIWRVG